MLSVFVDGQIFGQRVGSGTPRVLALHGWRGSNQQMLPSLQDKAGIAIDLPGFGASPIPKEIWGAADYARFISPILGDLDKPIILVGYSFGGRVAVNLAAEFPETIGGVVLVGVPLIRSGNTKNKPALGFRIVKKMNRMGLISDARMEAEKRKRGSADYRAATGIMRDIFVKVVNESYEDQLRQIICPVEMVWGSDDTEAPIGQAQQAQQLLKNAQMTVIQGGTHWLPTENPEPIRKAIQNLL
jgi:pimeloyl-ACP methyl ester carboxylesterase